MHVLVQVICDCILCGMHGNVTAHYVVHIPGTGGVWKRHRPPGSVEVSPTVSVWGSSISSFSCAMLLASGESRTT